MNWNNLSQESKDYIDRYIRNKNKTREQALQEKIIQGIISEYERETKEV
jgi:hypothetical protein